MNFAPPSASRLPSPIGGERIDREAAGRAAGDDRLDQRLLLGRLVDLDAERGGQGGARRLGLALGLLHHGVDAVGEEAVTGLLDEEGADDPDDDRGEHQRAQHDPRLHRATPEGRPVAQDRGQPVEQAHLGTCPGDLPAL